MAGAESPHTHRWTTFFAKRHEVYLISFISPPKDLDYTGVKVIVLKKMPLKLPWIAFALDTVVGLLQVRKAIRTIQPDIIHAHYIWRDALLAELDRSCPLVLTAWGSDILIQPK
ncbi:MAG: glycosyltransferase, partial [Methermicoccaceae archaeon]